MKNVKLQDKDQFVNRLVAIRKELHQHPELSLQEYETTKRLKRWLMDAGVSILPTKHKTGFIAEISGASPGPTIAYRTDIDALPIKEQTGLSYQSKNNGVSHACGHDYHMTVALGAALTLAENKQAFRGSVRFIFQPAEETTEGARQLIEEGLFEDGKIKAVFGLHNQPSIPAGKVGVTDGNLMAAVDSLEITIKGKGGHAAIPQHTVDPIVAGAAVVMGLQTAVSRNIDPLEPAVVTIGSMHAGTAQNVIADTAKLKGTVRSFHPTVRAQLPEIIERIVCDIASGYGAEATVNYIPEVPAIDNDTTMTNLVKESVCEVLGKESLVNPTPTMGGEDFSLYQQYVPGCYFWMGTGNVEKGVTKPWHDPAFLVNDDTLLDAVLVVVQTLLKSLDHFAE